MRTADEINRLLTALSLGHFMASQHKGCARCRSIVIAHEALQRMLVWVLGDLSTEGVLVALSIMQKQLDETVPGEAHVDNDAAELAKRN